MELPWTKQMEPGEAESTRKGAAHGVTLHEMRPAETCPRKRKKEGAIEHSWADNKRILTNALQELELEQLKQAVSATSRICNIASNIVIAHAM